MAGPVEIAGDLLAGEGVDLSELWENTALARDCAQALAEACGISYMAGAQLVELVADRYQP